MKVSPIAEIPHKSKSFRWIIYLLFLLKLTPHGRVPSVNENSKNTDQGGAIDQKVHVLLRLIHVFSEAPDCANIFKSKWDIKDVCWRLYCKEGEEWNFCYVLTHNPGTPIKLLVPISLQMGWIESTNYFCTVSETWRDVAEQQIENPVWSLAQHKFVEFTEVNSDIAELKNKDTSKEPLNYIMDVYMDDYIVLNISKDGINYIMLLTQ